MPDPIRLTVRTPKPISFNLDQLRVVEAVSPTVTTEQIDGGAKITITDLHGPHIVYLYDGADGRGIANTVLNADYTLTITYTDGTSYTTPSIRGADGKGIVSIVKTGTSGLVDTYTITYTDGTTGTLTVTNGRDGDNGVSPTVLIESITGGHRITITDAEHPRGQSIDVMDGQNGADGKGIVSVEKTGTIGLLDTYAITYTSGSPTIFTVTNGAPGTPGTDGTNAYVWIRYASAQPTQDSDMSTTPGPWMGVYSGSSATAPEHYTDYVWYEIKGDTPNVPVQDVQVNGTSILNNGVANVPIASSSQLGVVKSNSDYGVYVDGDYYYMRINTANDSYVKAGSNQNRPITPSNQHKSTFYGLAKAAGDTSQSASSNAVGVYTDAAKKAIRKMLGIPNQNWELIADATLDENSTEFIVSTDLNGQAFKLSKMIIIFVCGASTTGTRDSFYNQVQLHSATSNIDTSTSFPSWQYPSTEATNIIARGEVDANGGNAPLSYVSVVSATEGNTTNLTSMVKNTTFAQYIRGFRVYQSASNKSLVPAGSNIKIYGIRYDD